MAGNKATGNVDHAPAYATLTGWLPDEGEPAVAAEVAGSGLGQAAEAARLTLEHRLGELMRWDYWGSPTLVTPRSTG